MITIKAESEIFSSFGGSNLALYQSEHDGDLLVKVE